MVESGLVTAFGFLFILFRLNIRRVAGYALLVDLLATFGLMWIFQGTYAGMMTGLFAGGVLSIVLTLVKRTIGYERMHLVRMRGHLLPTIVWVYHSAKEV